MPLGWMPRRHNHHKGGRNNDHHLRFYLQPLGERLPGAIPVMDEYLMEWFEDGEGITEGVAGIIYPYLAALRALSDAGVEGVEKYIVELRTEEVGS